MQGQHPAVIGEAIARPNYPLWYKLRAVPTPGQLAAFFLGSRCDKFDALPGIHG